MKTALMSADNFEENNEKHLDLDIDVCDFDSTIASFEIDEDLDEKTISYLERLIRQSYEYKEYINYMKTELDLTKCALIPNLNQKELKFSLEFHHYPFNLFEIVQIIGSKMIDDLDEDKKLSAFDLCEKVMEEHYRNNIGLVPLSTTLHEMAHNKAIYIPMSSVNGNYKRFMKKYSDYIDEDLKDRVQENELDSITTEAKEYNTKKLEKTIVNYNITYNKDDD